ncbi:MAG: FAD-binding oxidoreductase, partial [Candidatus Limnocylindria bacterium]
MTSFLDAMTANLPDLQVLTDPADRESYRRDETVHHEPGLPMAVVLPSTTHEVAAVMRLATEHRVPVVPRGAGSGLSGGSAGVEGAITMVLTRMNRILEIDPDNLVAVVQPGVINADLKTAATEQGLFYAPDPASYEFCSIGGNIGTN